MTIEELERKLFSFAIEPEDFYKGMRALKVYGFIADEHISGFGWARSMRGNLKKLISEYLDQECYMGYAKGKHMCGEFYLLDFSRYSEIQESVEGFYSSYHFKPEDGYDK